jgi:acyl carrier protein
MPIRFTVRQDGSAMTQRDSIRATLVQFLREDTAAPTENLSDATPIRDGLGLDSVDFVGLVMRIEGHYRIRLSREELEALESIGDLLDLVAGKSEPAAIAAAA